MDSRSAPLPAIPYRLQSKAHRDRQSAVVSTISKTTPSKLGLSRKPGTRRSSLSSDTTAITSAKERALSDAITVALQPLHKNLDAVSESLDFMEERLDSQMSLIEQSLDRIEAALRTRQSATSSGEYCSS